MHDTRTILRPILRYTYIHQHVIVHEMVVHDKNKASLTVKWLFRVACLHIIRSGRSVMLHEVFGHGQVSASSPDEDT